MNNMPLRMLAKPCVTLNLQPLVFGMPWFLGQEGLSPTWIIGFLQDMLLWSPHQPIFVTTHYTGLGTVEHCMQRLSNKFNSRNELILWSGHEICESARAMILNAKHRPLHLFGDIKKQFFEEDVRYMEGIVECLHDRAKKLLKSASSQEESKRICSEVSQRCMRKLLDFVKDLIAKDRVKHTGYCYCHDDECPFFPPSDLLDEEGAVLLEAGGNSCVSFSPQGGRMGWLHPSAVVTAAWLGRTASRRPNFVFQECSSMFNSQEVLNLCFDPKDHWCTSVVKVKCSDVGVPMTRFRNYSWTIDTSKHSLVKGSISRNDWLELTQCPVMTTGHDFFVMEPHHFQDYLRKELFEKHRVPLKSLDDKKLSPQMVLSAGNKVRLAGYQDLLLSSPNVRGMEHPPKSMCGVLDLSQAPHVRQGLNSNLPSLLCHSYLWSQYHERMWHPLEALLMMGFPVASLHTSCAHEAPWSEAFLSQVRGSDLIQCCGNAMHCRVAGFFLAMCFALTTTTPAPSQTDDHE